MGAPGARIRRPESGKNKMRIAVSIATPAAGGAGTLDVWAPASALSAGGKSERAASGKRGKRVKRIRCFLRSSVQAACDGGHHLARSEAHGLHHQLVHQTGNH